MNLIEQLITTAPKTELHVHIEGTLEPELLFAIAQRNNISLPYKTVDELRKQYVFEDLQSFLDRYVENCAVLLTEQDYYDMTIAYLKRARKDNIVHAEIFIDIQWSMRRGIAPDVVLKGITRAIEQAPEFDMSAQLLFCFIRNFSQEEAFELFKYIEPYKQYIVGVGLAATEIGNPPSKFKKVFEHARDLGYKTVAHAGEEGGPEYIWQAIQELHVSRIDHGNNIVHDQGLIVYVADHAIALTMCPLSNLKLKAIDSLSNYPVKQLLDAGVLVTINSDGPAFFGGYVNENLKAVATACSLSFDQVVRLLANSFTASFLPLDRKQYYLDQLTRVITKLS